MRNVGTGIDHGHGICCKSGLDDHLVARRSGYVAVGIYGLLMGLLK